MDPNYFHSVVLKPERCIGCTCCLKICPTEAIRLKNGKASIIGERCIDCGECIRVCPNRAKNAITDDISIVNKFKYTIALALPVLYSQFNESFPPAKVLSALKSIGFDDACDTSTGSEAAGMISRYALSNLNRRPLISSSCPAILRLIQIRFPELLSNILDVETAVEITARLIKTKVSREKGLDLEDIGVILLTPCTARVTSIKNPLGIESSYIDGSISIKDIYGPVLAALAGINPKDTMKFHSTYNSMLYNCAGGQVNMIKDENSLSVDGIHEVISILEEIDLGKLDNLSFIELTACPGGCLGGPLVVENRYIAQNRIKKIAADQQAPSLHLSPDGFIDMYKSGFIRLTKKIEPKLVTRLDPDISKSIKKMDFIESIVNSLPGINCGICGSPTCRAFAEDVVMGNLKEYICPIVNISEKLNKNVVKEDML